MALEADIVAVQDSSLACGVTKLLVRVRYSLPQVSPNVDAYGLNSFSACAQHVWSKYPVSQFYRLCKVLACLGNGSALGLIVAYVCVHMHVYCKAYIEVSENGHRFCRMNSEGPPRPSKITANRLIGGDCPTGAMDTIENTFVLRVCFSCRKGVLYDSASCTSVTATCCT